MAGSFFGVRGFCFGCFLLTGFIGEGVGIVLAGLSYGSVGPCFQ